MNTKRVIVALDNMTLTEATFMAELVKDEAAGIKVGFELLCDEGAKNVARALLPFGLPCFFDPKLHDIPNTAAQAARKLARQGAWIINLHCSGGRKMMLAIRNAVDEVWEKERHSLILLTRKPLVIGVTILTSLDHHELSEVILPVEFEHKMPKNLNEEEQAEKIREIVLKMAMVAEECGLDGLVMSPKEVPMIRKMMQSNPLFQIITPGIRLASDKQDDQIRTGTPAKAIEDGANWLVVGRPVTQSKNPKETLKLINQQVAEALAKTKGTVTK